MAIGAAVDNASETSGDLNKEAWDKYNALRAAILEYHETSGAHKSTGDVVLKALFDANTILVANSDDTPAALTVAASRIIGRKSTGNIAALTAAEVNTLLSTATRALDNLTGVAINTSLISDADDTDDLGSASKEWRNLYIDGTANIDSLIADTADINGGTVDGITSLTAGGDLDIGAHGFRAQSLTADGLASGKVVITSTNGLLAVRTIGIADDNIVEIDHASAADNDYAKFTANGLEGRSYAEVRSDINVEDGSTADQTGAEIVTLLEALSAGSRLSHTKLDDIGASDHHAKYLDSEAVTAAKTVKLDDFTAPDDTTDLDATASLHGLMSKAYAGKLDGIEASADVTDATNVNAAGAVMEADFNAQTILAATADDTPAALTVAEQTLVGRITSGNIAALSATQVRTLLNVENGATDDQTEAEILTLLGVTSAEIDQIENIGTTTISAAQWGYVGALTTDPLGGDGTAGRIVRACFINILDGTNAATLKINVGSRWNGDVIVQTDNVEKNATTGNFTLSADGGALTVEAAGLTGNVVCALGLPSTNASGTDLITQVRAESNDILIYVTNATAGTVEDLTTLVDTGKILVEVLYITDA